MKELHDDVFFTASLFTKGKLPRELGALWAKERSEGTAKIVDPLPELIRQASFKIPVVIALISSLALAGAVMGWMIYVYFHRPLPESPFPLPWNIIALAALAGCAYSVGMCWRKDQYIPILNEFASDVMGLVKYFELVDYHEGVAQTIPELQQLIAKKLKAQTERIHEDTKRLSEEPYKWGTIQMEWAVFAQKTHFAKVFGLGPQGAEITRMFRQ